MRPGGEKRGSSYDRRRRKRWLLTTFGDGQTCACVHCGTALDYATVEADRIEPGGTYARSNVQPACRDCNASRSNRREWRGPAWGDADPRVVAVIVTCLIHTT